MEHDIPYVEAISTEQFLREQLANSTTPTVPVDAEVQETPVKLEIVEPSVDAGEGLVVEENAMDVDNVAEVKNNRRR